MTSAAHVCARCGEVHSSRYIALGPCSRALPSAHRDGEQSPTSDEPGIDRLRFEVAALTSRTDALEAEVARLRRLVTAAASALDGLPHDAAALGFHVHPSIVAHLHRMAVDLRAVLDQEAR